MEKESIAIGWSEMPSTLWKIWFLASRLVWFVLIVTGITLFLATFVLSPSSGFFLPFAAITCFGLVFLILQQALDVYYAHNYLLSKTKRLK